MIRLSRTTAENVTAETTSITTQTEFVSSVTMADVVLGISPLSALDSLPQGVQEGGVLLLEPVDEISHRGIAELSHEPIEYRAHGRLRVLVSREER
jgi:hypothetical protein